MVCDSWDLSFNQWRFSMLVTSLSSANFHSHHPYLLCSFHFRSKLFSHYRLPFGSVSHFTDYYTAPFLLSCIGCVFSFFAFIFYHLLFPAHCDRLKFLSHRIRRGTARYGTLPYGACTLPYGTRFYVKAATHGAVPCRMRFEITLVWLFSELLSAPWLSSSSSLSWSLIQTKCP